MIQTFLISYIVGFILSGFGVKLLQKINMRQSIRKEGPATHIKKSGTPTMGGIFIILTIVITYFVVNPTFDPKVMVAIFALVGFGIVGLLDDLTKKLRKKNLGLKSWQKMLGILIVTGFIIGYMISSNDYLSLHPFLLNIGLHIPAAFALFAFFVIAGTSNAYNLTDGLDGLAAGTGTIAFAAFAFLCHYKGEFGLSIICAAATGALFSFLWFNHKPAQVFMGDVGSLAIGGLLGTVAVLTHTELNLLVIGGIYVIEALSVILQVSSFKLTGKRIFKMSPIHHHFELIGWPEIKVVIRFWIIALILGVIGIYIG